MHTYKAHILFACVRNTQSTYAKKALFAFMCAHTYIHAHKPESHTIASIEAQGMYFRTHIPAHTHTQITSHTFALLLAAVKA